ncbi:MFS transporter [Helcobacillus massiliensis]|uniref:MFS transporter n=1 Tax=Helcobacillus massiliensis TaxID=521392 RepID=UPI0021A53EA1|nr:MFS transporter [Helcobacillus massiliensis]MCT1558489.1 MFS transporter [Helcobacillus massiliensis]MCT2037259.1 MFS transporter [Helcobacillus massiliensis]MCT2332058.1 MFS transporter [Helcobacillus massiliensis]
MFTPSPSLARLGISAQFLTNGALLASLMPRLPEVKDRFALDDHAFGFLVIAVAVGALIAAPAAGAVIRRAGALPTMVVGSVLVGVLVTAAAGAPTAMLFVLAMMAAGAADAVVDTAQNLQGLAVQRWKDSTILGSLHAAWSIGATLGGAIGTWAAAASVPLMIHMGINSCIWIVVVVLAAAAARTPDRFVRRAEEQDPSTASSAPAPRRFLGPAVLTLVALSLLAIAGTMVEDVANNWSALFTGRELGASPGLAGLAFTLTLTAQVVGRFATDPISNRVGMHMAAVGGGVLIAAGGLTAALAPSPAVGIAGFMLMGLGCGPLVPAALAGADAIPGLRHGTGVTVLSWSMRIGMLATSPIIGLVSVSAGLRIGLLVTVAGGLVGAAIAFHQGRRVHLS